MQIKVSLSILIHYPFVIHLVKYRANTGNQPLLDLIVSCYLVDVFFWEVIVEILEIYDCILDIEESSHYFTY